jgi:hypothetical protein
MTQGQLRGSGSAGTCEDSFVYVSLARVNSKDQPTEHRVARMQFLNRMTSVAGVEVEETSKFEVTLAELGPRLNNFSAS